MLNGSETRANRNGHSVWNERCKNFYKSIEYSLHRRQTNNKKWNVFVMIAALADHRSPHSRIHSTWLSSVSIRSHSVWFEIGDSVLFFFIYFSRYRLHLFAQNEKTKWDSMSCYESASVPMRVSFGSIWFRYFRRKLGGLYFRIIRNVSLALCTANTCPPQG